MIYLKVGIFILSLSFICDTQSSGLNANDIAIYEILIKNFYNTPNIIQTYLNNVGIVDKFAMFNWNEPSNIMIDKCLNILAETEKSGDNDSEFERLTINDVKNITNIFHEKDDMKNGVLNKDQCYSLIDDLYHTENNIKKSRFYGEDARKMKKAFEKNRSRLSTFQPSRSNENNFKN
ncbi:uncharacterized protein LOC126905997 isoform X2 [Daktulosphaira vitifoliae]|uniref:uncharacterized protein LOC126905997 isoform X2 n=1 Tax=Daktulosphaira vitifoliae TaxID=58002 RepID=UPI0021AAB438|nr:uncharacterized protein LOC126905997 isoform X2 [Daktulosphaira vitifoliae]